MDIIGFIRDSGLRALVLAGIILFILAAGWVHARLRGVRPPNEVRAGSFVVGTGWFATLIGVSLTWVLINADRMIGPGQFWPFLLIWAGFLFGGLYLLLYEGRFMLRHDARGIRWRQGFSGWREARWGQIAETAFLPSQQALAFIFSDGRRLKISTLSAGLDEMAEAAERAGVPGFEPEPWSPESSSY